MLSVFLSSHQKQRKRGVAETALRIGFVGRITAIGLIGLVFLVRFVGLVFSIFRHGTFLKTNAVALVINDQTVFKPSQVLAIVAVNMEVVLVGGEQIGHGRAVPHIDGEVVRGGVYVGDGVAVGVKQGDFFGFGHAGREKQEESEEEFFHSEVCMGWKIKVVFRRRRLRYLSFSAFSVFKKGMCFICRAICRLRFLTYRLGCLLLISMGLGSVAAMVAQSERLKAEA